MEEPSLEPVLIGSVGNDPSGFWVFDTDSLNKIDSLHLDYTPLGMTFNQELSTMYWVQENTLHEHNLQDSTFKNVPTQGAKVVSNDKGSYLLTYRNELTQLYDSETLEMLRQDSIGFFYHAIASVNEDRFYGLITDRLEGGTQRDFVSIDAPTLETEIVYSLTSKMEVYDFTISPDESYLYVTLTTESTGSFLIINLKTGELVSEFECGSFARIGASPDGKSVYLTSRPSYFEANSPADQVLSYDVQTNSMSILIDGPNDIGLNSDISINGSSFSTWDALVGHESQTLYLIVGGNTKTQSGESVHLLQLDIKEKKVLNTFAIPENDQGKIGTLIYEIGWGSNR